jgi:ADP-ribose pyrophosphatase YjhB (NUDIX family)
MPEAGFCASSFVLVRNGHRVLAGIPRNHRKWREQWQPNISTYRPQDQEAEFRSWRLPAAFLYEGEHPDDTARRVIKDQLRIPLRKFEGPSVYSFYDPSSWYPGRRHYDLCFVYEVRGSEPRETPAWWQRLELVDRAFLRRQELGSAMSDLVVRAKL